MNNRIRQKIRAMAHRENPDLFAILRTDTEWGTAYNVMFVPRGEVEAYKGKYGDRLCILAQEWRPK